MKHLSPLNAKARRLADALDPPSLGDLSPGPASAGHPPSPHAASAGQEARDVVALEGPPQQPQGAHVPLGCSTIFAPGWEVDRTGGTAGLCQPVERDLFDCHLGCFWPAQVPDQLNHAPDWTKKCAAAQKDWRQIDIIFP